MATRLDENKIAKLTGLFKGNVSEADSLAKAAKELDQLAKARFALGTATADDSSYLKRVGVIKEPNKRNMTAGERANARIQKQDWLADDPQQELFPWVGSVQATKDSVNADMKSKPKDALRETADRIKYSDQIRKMRTRRKYEEQGAQALNPEENRILFGNTGSKTNKERTPFEAMMEYSDRLNQIDKALIVKEKDDSGQEQEFYNPNLNQENIQALLKQKESLQDSLYVAQKAQKYIDQGVNMPVEAMQAYMNAMQKDPEAYVGPELEAVSQSMIDKGLPPRIIKIYQHTVLAKIKAGRYKDDAMKEAAQEIKTLFPHLFRTQP